MEALIEDAKRTLLLPVSLAEELPARETVELVDRLRRSVAIAVDRVVVNMVTPAPFPPGLGDLDERLGHLPVQTELGALPPPPVLAACAGHLRARFELNRHYLDEIRTLTGLPVIALPQLPSGVRGPDDLSGLGDALVGAAASGDA